MIVKMLTHMHMVLLTWCCWHICKGEGVRVDERHKSRTYTDSGLIEANPVSPVLGNRWHRFVSAELTASCLKSRWHRFWKTGGTGFLWVAMASFWGNGYLRPWSPTVAWGWF